MLESYLDNSNDPGVFVDVPNGFNHLPVSFTDWKCVLPISVMYLMSRNSVEG